MITFIETDQMGGPITPEAILIHFTGGGTLSGCVETFKNGGVSAHLIIDRDGTVVQMVPYNMKAWHAGASEWEGKRYLNNWSIGIELVNWGPLILNNDQFFSRYHAPVKPPVFRGFHANGSKQFEYWQFFSYPQLFTLKDMIGEIRKSYEIKLILGHEEVAPKRKIDPGPAFPWTFFRNKDRSPL